MPRLFQNEHEPIIVLVRVRMKQTGLPKQVLQIMDHIAADPVVKIT